MNTTRFVRRDTRLYAFSDCRFCGRCRGACQPTTCLACGTTQCMGNGGARGQCGVCLYGLLPGWSGSDRPCGYKGCSEKAVAGSVPRVGNCCKTHLDRPKIKSGGMSVSILDFVSAQLIERSKTWVQVTEAAPLPIGGGSSEPYLWMLGV